MLIKSFIESVLNTDTVTELLKDGSVTDDVVKVICLAAIEVARENHLTYEG